MTCLTFLPFDGSGGNQRDLAREKNQKKLQEQQKKKSAADKTGNKGLSLEERKHRFVLS